MAFATRLLESSISAYLFALPARTMPPVSDSSVSVVVQLVCCAVWHAGKQKYWYDCAAHTEAAVVTGMCGSKWMVQQELGRWDEGRVLIGKVTQVWLYRTVVGRCCLKIILLR